MIIKTKLFYEGKDANYSMDAWDSRYGELDLNAFLIKVKY